MQQTVHLPVFKNQSINFTQNANLNIIYLLYFLLPSLWFYKATDTHSIKITIKKGSKILL